MPLYCYDLQLLDSLHYHYTQYLRVKLLVKISSVRLTLYHIQHFPTEGREKGGEEVRKGVREGGYRKVEEGEVGGGSKEKRG